MNNDIVLCGIHIGEHSYNVDSIIDEIKVRCVDRGYNFAIIRPKERVLIPQEYFPKWARYLADNKIYFVFLYTLQYAPDGCKSHLEPETVSEVKAIAGKYYIGDMLGELGSDYTSKWKRYPYYHTPARIDDMSEAHNDYLKNVGYWVDLGRSLGVPAIVSVEATGLSRYNAEAGIDIPMLELMCGHPEILISALRGTARATDAGLWGTYIAHEWYGGMRHLDVLKRKRLSLAIKYAYMSGSQLFCLESGDECIGSYGDDFDSESIVCQEYSNELQKFSDYVKEDKRPCGGPKVKVAFIQGTHDAWGGWGGSSLWNQFDRTEWGYGEAEHSWRLLEDINIKREWCDIANFGDQDLSASPAYGMYDIIPSESSIETFSKYDYLIFAGWNSMTDELIHRLTQYVEQGGKLLMTAAHLNCSTLRNGEKKYISNDKFEKLFGCRYSGETVLTNDGIKFEDKSIAGIMYPGSKNKECDPIYSEGYVSYLKTVPDTCLVVGERQDSFDNISMDLPMVIENKVGNGVAILVTSENYPGYPALYPLYRAIVREIMTKSARECDIKVISSSALRYSVYEGNKVYLLNTDYDVPITVKMISGDTERNITLKPLELNAVTL